MNDHGLGKSIAVALANSPEVDKPTRKFLFAVSLLVEEFFEKGEKERERIAEATKGAVADVLPNTQELFAYMEKALGGEFPKEVPPLDRFVGVRKEGE